LKSGGGILSSASGVLSNTPYSFKDRFEQGTGTNPESIVVDPGAKFIFVINEQSNSVTEFTINKDGTLATTGNALQLSVAPRSLSLTR